MVFWIVIACLTVLVALMLLWPLLRPSYGVSERAAGEAAVYRDQLSELDRDREAGLISVEQATYARAEIGRRLLAATGRSERATGKSGRNALAQAFVVLALPAIGLGLYLVTGSPGLPGAPLAARLANPGNNIDLLVAKAERHLAQNPTDGAGWDILAPIYFRLQRVGDAELAYRNALRYRGPSAARYNGLAETLMAAGDGIVTADARDALEQAVRLEPDNPQARFYLALADEQAGEKDKARAAFEALAAATPAGAPWLPLVRQHIAANGGPSPGPEIGQVAPAQPDAGAAPGGPDAAAVAAAQDMSGADRMEMVRGMVASLDARLKQEPNNFEGWMRLVRSYAVLKQPDQALAALKAGLAVFPADGAQGQQLVALGQELGLPGAEALK